MSESAIHTIGTILDHPHPVLYRTELANGKVVLAHLSRPLAHLGATFDTGARVLLEMTPFDFDQARILGPAEE